MWSQFQIFSAFAAQFPLLEEYCYSSVKKKRNKKKEIPISGVKSTIQNQEPVSFLVNFPLAKPLI